MKSVRLRNRNGIYFAVWKTKNYKTACDEAYDFLVNNKIFDVVKLEYSPTLGCTIKLNDSKIKELQNE